MLFEKVMKLGTSNWKDLGKSRNVDNALLKKWIKGGKCIREVRIYLETKKTQHTKSYGPQLKKLFDKNVYLLRPVLVSGIIVQ